MLGDRIGGRLESRDRVALLALILVRLRRELPAMRIFVAIRALRKGDCVASAGSGWDMAGRAGNRSVLALQRVGYSCVFLYTEGCGFPSLHRMASAAFAFILAGSELPSVGIRRMASGARRERHRLLEICLGVALGAFDLRVLSKQRELCLRMIELLRRRNLPPATRRMAGLAGLRKRSVMRIGVAIRTFGERHTGKSRGASGFWRGVAFRASDVRVQAHQREPGFRMVELCGRLPVNKVVALQAVLSELAVMNILVTCHASLRQPEKGLAQVLHHQRTFRSSDMSGHMTVAALDPRVLSL